VRRIKVLGPGCKNCVSTAEVVEEIAISLGIEVEVEKVTDMAEIMEHGVLTTPAVVVDGTVVHAGGVPRRREIEGWLRAPA
jgi:small redox-active disulfide protein 2